MLCSNGLEITCDKENVWKIQNVLAWSNTMLYFCVSCVGVVFYRS